MADLLGGDMGSMVFGGTSGLSLGPLAGWALQDPVGASSFFATQGAPPANLLQRIAGGLGGAMQPIPGTATQGVQTPAAPDPRFVAGVSNAQGVPAAHAAGQPVALQNILGAPQFKGVGGLPTLGSLIAGSRQYT